MRERRCTVNKLCAALGGIAKVPFIEGIYPSASAIPRFKDSHVNTRLSELPAGHQACGPRADNYNLCSLHFLILMRLGRDDLTCVGFVAVSNTSRGIVTGKVACCGLARW